MHTLKAIFVFVLMISSLWSSDEAFIQSLSAREQAWLKDHPLVRIAYDSHFPPYSFLDQNQNIKGYSKDLIDVISELTGVKFESVAKCRSGLYSALQNQEVDFVASLVRDSAREEDFLFSQAYIFKSIVICKRQGEARGVSRKDLEGKKMAFVEKAFLSKDLLKKIPTIKPLYLSDYHEALLSVSTKRTDACAVPLAVASYYLNQFKIDDVEISGMYSSNLSQECFTVRKNWSTFRGILNKALDFIDQEKKEKLKEKWLSLNSYESEKTLLFTKEEQAWLDANKSITLGADYKWPPLDYADKEGRHQGLAKDYLDIIRQKTGLTVNVEPDIWAKVINKVKLGKIGGLVCAVETKERQEYLRFTKPYLKVPLGILARKDRADIQGPKDLDGKIVSVNKGSYMHEWMKTFYPKSQLHLSISNTNSLLAVSRGEADAYVGNIAVASYIQKEQVITNLRIVDQIPGLTTAVSIAFPKKDIIPQRIFDKVLANIDLAEHHKIRDKWYQSSFATQKERKQKRPWLKKNPVIRVLRNSSTLDTSGQVISTESFSNDYLKLLNEKLGFKIEYVHSRLSPIELIKANKVDLILNSLEESQHKNLLNFSFSYLSNPTIVFTRTHENLIDSIEDLKGRQVATTNASHVKFFPHEQELIKTSILEGVEKVRNNKVDAVITCLLEMEQIERSTLNEGLKKLSLYDDKGFRSDIKIAIRKDWPELSKIINEAIKDIDEHRVEALHFKWFDQIEKKGIKPGLSLSQSERNWIKNNPILRVGADSSWPPFSFYEESGGRQAGLSKDYLELISLSTGLQFVFHQDKDWLELQNKLSRKEIDLLSMVSKTSARENFIRFTDHYFTLGKHVYARQKVPARSIAELSGKTFALVKGSSNSNYIRSHFPKIKIKNFLTTKDCIMAVLNRQADLMVSSPVILQYISKKEHLVELKSLFEIKDNQDKKYSFGVRTDLPILRSILNKAIAYISLEKRKQIYQKWLSSRVASKHHLKAQTSRVKLSSKEKKWLKNNPTVTMVGDPDWAPLSSYDKEGRYVGIIPDIWQLILEKSGVKIHFANPQNWSESLAQFKANKVDIIDALSPTAEREKYCNFSKPYFAMDYVLATRRDAHYIKDFDKLKDSEVSTVTNYVSHEHLKKDYAHFKLTTYKDAETGLKALAHGQNDVFIIDLPSFEHWTKVHRLSNLKVSGLAPFRYQLAVAVQKDQPELLSIINKSLTLISEEDIDNVYLQRSELTPPHVDYTVVWQLSAVGLIILLIIAYWNLRLHREIKLRYSVEEDLILAKEHAEAANLAKSLFLTNISHEIRTPMNSILGFSEILKKQESDLTKAQYLSTLNSSAKSLLSLINDILDFAKIESGTLQISYQESSIREIFNDIKALFLSEASNKKNMIITKLSDDFPDELYLPPLRIRQILINLVSNSVKFTSGGSITVSAKFYRDLTDKNLGELVLSISDTGSGIPEESLEKIFRPFEQSIQDEHCKTPGTGLGLSISSELSRAMAGELSVKSQIGQGSTFTLTIPNVKVIETLNDTRRGCSQDMVFDRAHILIADDTKYNRDLLVAYLHEYPFSFDTASNGEEVLEKITIKRPDLILLDMQMPKLNGSELIQKINGNEALKNIPIIIISASAKAAYTEILAQYDYSYIEKPLTEEILLREISSILPFTLKKTSLKDTALENKTRPIAAISLNSLLEDLELKEIRELCQKVNVTLTVNEIVSLLDLLDEIAEAYPEPDFIAWKKDLHEAFSNFEMEALSKRLQTYPEVIELLQSKLDDADPS